VAAAWHEDHDDVIAGLQVGHVLAQRLDDAGGLVAQGHRHRAGTVAVDDGQVAMAQAGGGDPHQHLVPAWRRKVQGGDA